MATAATWQTVVRVIAGTGRVGRFAFTEADLLRGTGLRAAQRHRHDATAAASWAPAARRSLYERIWRQAASEIGATIEALPSSFWVLRRGGRRTIARFHLVELDSPVALELALDKKAVHDLLTGVGIPVPEHLEIRADGPLDEAAALLGEAGPLVVKPASGTSGGAGVTCGVTTRPAFYRAAVHAWRAGDGRLLVERQASGDEYRFLLLDGTLIDVVRRRQARVTGDGRSTIAQLISRENERRAAAAGSAGISFLDIDLDTILELRRCRLTLSSVLAPGVVQAVKAGTTASGAADNETVPLTDIGDELVEQAAAAASTAGLRLAGVDLVTPDLTKPLGDVGGVVLEVNGTPGFHYHYLVVDQERATPVAVPVLTTLLSG